jgi:hypothetical protein
VVAVAVALQVASLLLAVADRQYMLMMLVQKVQVAPAVVVEEQAVGPHFLQVVEGRQVQLEPLPEPEPELELGAELAMVQLPEPVDGTDWYTLNCQEELGPRTAVSHKVAQLERQTKAVEPEEESELVELQHWFRIAVADKAGHTIAVAVVAVDRTIAAVAVRLVVVAVDHKLAAVVVVVEECNLAVVGVGHNHCHYHCYCRNHSQLEVLVFVPESEFESEAVHNQVAVRSSTEPTVAEAGYNYFGHNLVAEEADIGRMVLELDLELELVAHIPCFPVEAAVETVLGILAAVAGHKIAAGCRLAAEAVGTVDHKADKPSVVVVVVVAVAVADRTLLEAAYSCLDWVHRTLRRDVAVVGTTWGPGNAWRACMLCLLLVLVAFVCGVTCLGH